MVRKSGRVQAVDICQHKVTATWIAAAAGKLRVSHVVSYPPLHTILSMIQLILYTSESGHIKALRTSLAWSKHVTALICRQNYDDCMFDLNPSLIPSLGTRLPEPCMGSPPSK